MKPLRKRPPASWPLLLLFFAVALSAVVIGFVYYFYQKNNILREKQSELTGISYLKIRQITQWRDERLENAKFLGGNVLLVKNFSGYLGKPRESQLKDDILQNLRSLTEHFDYKEVFLLGKDGSLSLSFPAKDTTNSASVKSLIAGMKSKKILFTDQIVTGEKLLRIDLIVPLIGKDADDTIAHGYLDLRIDPQETLYPMLQSLPSAYKSAETLLLKRENDDFIYLNKPSGFSDNAYNHKSLVEQAFQGITGTVNGIDFRNNAVLAAMNKIPGTSWYLITKVNRTEVLASLTSQMELILIILVLVIVTSGSFLAFLIRSRRADYYRGKYEDELNRLALIKHFDYILIYANDIILLINSDLIIVEANDRALEFYKYTREEFIGKNIESLRAPEERYLLAQNISMVDSMGSATFETVHIRKDNTTFPVELSTRVVIIENIKYYQTIGRDITDRKIVENILRESEEKFRKIFQESPFSMLMTGKDFNIIKANSTYCDLIGYSEDELKQFTFRNFTHPAHIKGDEIALLKLIAGEIPVYKVEKRYIRKDGSVLWGSTTVSIIRDKNDEAQFFLVMIEDITARKKATIELDNYISLLKATFESTEDGLLVVNSEGKIVQYNQKFVDMWRIPLDVISTGMDRALINYVQNELINPELFANNIEELYSSQETTSFELLEFVDGRYFERYSQPQKINGACVGRVWSFRDVTNRMRAEEELIASKEKAEESDRLKTAFLHNVSHEIRTPMNAIIGFSSMLKDFDLTNAERNQYIEIIFQSGGQLLSIINDIVDIANVESGQAKVNLTVFNLNSALKSLNEQFSMNCKEKNISLTMSVPLDDEEFDIKADNTKLVQILSNLINNAVKFTKDGKINFGYNIHGKFLEFFVEDTGIGITHEHQKRIFDRFYQVDSAVSRQYSGTGLGLSICKGYVELLGGEIEVKSEPGEGTRFLFSIPYEPAKVTG
jgi:PAS domain S-box-containing protein